jgi:hypothetical protein
MGATATLLSLVAQTSIAVLYILVATVVARYLLRNRGGKIRIWIPPAIFITIEITQPNKSDQDEE